MKKLFATVLAASMMLVGVNAFAQISVGAGYVNSTSTTKVSDNKSDSNLNGFYAGASYNIPVVGSFGIAPGVYYEFLIKKSDEAGIAGFATAKGTDTEHYINVPVMLNYGLDLASDCRLFVYAGPTLSYGIASQTKYDVNTIVGDGSKTVDNYGDDSSYKRLDVMLGGGVGFDISAIQVKVGYNYGMLNRYDSDDVTLHRSEIHLGVAFNF